MLYMLNCLYRTKWAMSMSWVFSPLDLFYFALYVRIVAYDMFPVSKKKKKKKTSRKLPHSSVVKLLMIYMIFEFKAFSIVGKAYILF